MKEYCGEDSYTPKYVKKRVIEHLADDVIITEIKRKPNVVTFFSNAASILHKFYERPKQQDDNVEKLRIIETAANLIKNDIKLAKTSKMSCIYSMLLFVSEEASAHNVTPVVTFDQPLWWKAVTIISCERKDSDLRSIVLRLGVFNMQMSFLGCIGYLMHESGLKKTLETIYTPNAVTHMLSGKAVSRAVRGHFIVDSALNALLISKAFGIKHLEQEQFSDLALPDNDTQEDSKCKTG